jgi:hypothetical protein
MNSSQRLKDEVWLKLGFKTKKSQAPQKVRRQKSPAPKAPG